MTAQTTCPKCGEKAIPVVYGYPTPEIEEQARGGALFLGGCMVGAGIDPDFRCTSCGYGWRVPRPPRVRFTEGRRALEEALEVSAGAGDLDHVRTLARTITDAGRDEGIAEGHVGGRAEGPRHAAKNHSEQAKARDKKARDDVVRLTNEEGLTAKEIAQKLRPTISERKVVELKRLAREDGIYVRGRKRRR